MGAPCDFRSAHLVRYKTYNGQLFIIQQFVDKNGHIGYRHPAVTVQIAAINGFAGQQQINHDRHIGDGDSAIAIDITNFTKSLDGHELVPVIGCAIGINSILRNL